MTPRTGYGNVVVTLDAHYKNAGSQRELTLYLGETDSYLYIYNSNRVRPVINILKDEL